MHVGRRIHLKIFLLLLRDIHLKVKNSEFELEMVMIV